MSALALSIGDCGTLLGHLGLLLKVGAFIRGTRIVFTLRQPDTSQLVRIMSIQYESTVARLISRSAPALTVKLITGDVVPSQLIDSAAALDSGGPFGRAIWWESWWRHLRPRGSQLFLLSVLEGDKLLGLAPWYIQRAYGFGRVVRCLGDGRASSDYMTICAAPSRREEVWREVTKWVAAEAGRSWDTMILSGVSAADEQLHAFCEQVRQQDVVVDQRTVTNTWRVSLPETWEAYIDLFSKQQRNRLRRTKRDMLDSGRAVMHRVTSLADFDRGFEIQRHLHQRRRNSLGDRGCYADPKFEAFVHEANQRFLQQGKLRLQWTAVDGQPVAFDAGYVDQKGVFVYQTAFDPDWSDLSPGRLHLQASILKAIEEGYRFFDFLRGDEPYKAHFRASPIPLLETRLIAPRVLPRLGHRTWNLQKQLKGRIRATLRPKVSPSTDSTVAGVSTAVNSDVESLSMSKSSVALDSDARHYASTGEVVPKTRFRALSDDRRRFGARCAAKGFVYRVARRLCRLRIVHVLSMELAELTPPRSLPKEFEYRWLKADDIRAHAADPANDLDSSLAERLEKENNYCFAAFDGSQLANYSWYAPDSIEPEHSFDAGLTYPPNTLYLYKAYTHPRYRGRRVHQSAVSRAAQFFAERGVSRLIALVEYANWASLTSHERLGCRNVGWILTAGRHPLRFERYPRLADTLGISFGDSG